MNNSLFELSYQELKLLVTKFHLKEDVITNPHERLGYLKRVRSENDKRIVYLAATTKLKKGVELYEDMKLNELHALSFTKKNAPTKPSLSDFNLQSADQLRKDFLDSKN